MVMVRVVWLTTMRVGSGGFAAAAGASGVVTALAAVVQALTIGTMSMHAASDCQCLRTRPRTIERIAVLPPRPTDATRSTRRYSARRYRENAKDTPGPRYRKQPARLGP